MKEKKINYGLLIFVLVIVVLFIPIIKDYVNTLKIEVVDSIVLSNKIKAKESFLVFYGDLDKNNNKELRKMRDYVKNDFSYDYGVYNVLEKTEEYSEDIVAALIIEGDIQKLYTKFDNKEISEDVKTYLVADIDETNRTYKEFENFDDYKKTIKKDELNMIVFGRQSCPHCNRFKIVYNAVAEKYDLNIYYFDSDNYDKNEYKKVINYELKVPGKCSSSGKDFMLSDGFGTPLTIFTKKGKVVDCIGGYVDRTRLVSQLKGNKMISE